MPHRPFWFNKHAVNITWVLFEYGLRLVSGLVVGLMIARHLGATAFGELSYIAALVSLLSAFSRLGIESIALRDISQHREREQSILMAALLVLGSAGALAFAGFSVFAFWTEPDHGLRDLMLISAAGAMLSQPFLVFELAFQARLEGRSLAAAKVAAFVLITVLKLTLLFLGAGLTDFVYVNAVTQLVVALAITFKAYGVVLGSVPRRVTWADVAGLVRPAFPLAITAVSATIYMKVDQVMIRYYLGEANLGQYAVAVRMYEAWIAFPLLAATALVPSLVEGKERGIESFRSRMVIMLTGLVWSSVLAIVIVAVAAPLVRTVLGPEFAQVPWLALLLMVASVPAALGFGSTRYFLVNRMESEIAKRVILCAVVNVALNVRLIPAFGLEGAAVATIVSLIVTNYFADWRSARFAEIRAIKTAALFLPLRAVRLAMRSR